MHKVHFLLKINERRRDSDKPMVLQQIKLINKGKKERKKMFFVKIVFV